MKIASHMEAPELAQKISADYPGLDLQIHAAAEWGESEAAFAAAEEAVMHGDIIISNLLFL